ncbi:MAG: STAS domain-containing protein [Planctomycetota bacterium]
MAELDVNEQPVDGVPRVSLSGRLDIDTAPELRHVLNRYVEDEVPALILDLSGLDYMDTSGLATVVEAHSRLDGHGGRVVLCGLSGSVLEVFTMNEVAGIFTIVEDAEAAAEELR